MTLQPYTEVSMSDDKLCTVAPVQATPAKSILLPKRVRNLLGQKFGRLLVVEYLGIHRDSDSRTRSVWGCLCDCGNKHDSLGYVLTRGNTRSCGCLRETHGLATRKKTRHPSYLRWIAMIQRCENPNNKNYKYYGGRGISVCQRWRESVEAYVEDVGHCPAPGLSLDRIDNNGNYEPGNCRWATRREQRLNQRPRQKSRMPGIRETEF